MPIALTFLAIIGAMLGLAAWGFTCLVLPNKVPPVLNPEEFSPKQLRWLGLGLLFFSGFGSFMLVAPYVRFYLAGDI